MAERQHIFDTNKSTLDTLDSEFLRSHNVQLAVKRDDLIHEQVSGNKWRKLKYNVEACLSSRCNRILTFGGAYSNHLLATASAANQLNLKSIGIVRGDELSVDSNQTLRDCNALGMELVFVTRDQYKERYESQYHEVLKLEYPSTFIVPEGGANYHGIVGCTEIFHEIPDDIDDIFVAQGTTTTSCGLLLPMKRHQCLHVIPALKGFDSLHEMKWLLNYSGIETEFIMELMAQVEVLDEYHFGGYGKYDNTLLSFMVKFEDEYGIPLDQVYTAKCMYGLFDQIQTGKLDGKKIVFVHTGGIQGKRSLLMQ